MRISAPSPAPQQSVAEPKKSAQSLSGARVKGARAKVVDERFSERLHMSLVERALGPVQTKSAVNTGYGDLIAATSALAARAPDATGMPAPVRAKMEGALGADFSDVRVHPGSARAVELGALAFTQGSDIHVAPGQWAPESTKGQELLGHELGHVLQQRTGRVKPTAQLKGEGLNDEPALEAEADAMGARAAREGAAEQRTPFAGGASAPAAEVQRKCAACDAEMEQPTQRKAEAGTASKQAAPQTGEGERLLAPVLQLKKLADYSDADPLHDPSRLSDTEVEATDEYKAYMAMNPPPIPQRWVTPEDARLACRLLLRNLRETPGPAAAVTSDVLQNWLIAARARQDVGAVAAKTVGTESWVAASAGDVMSPTTAASEFTKWMIGGGTKPDPATGKLNCWEMVLFSAYRAGYVSEAKLRDIYTKSKAAMSGPGGVMAFPRTLEAMLRTSKENIYDPADPKSPRPLQGDIVIFKEAANHVALATGNMVGGKVEIISHWPPPDGDHHAKRTTIEALLPAVGVTVAKFWSPIW